MEKQRISKIMASRGMCSRREADRSIERGLVIVDGEVISELGSRVDPDAKIELAAAGQKRQDDNSKRDFRVNQTVVFP